MAVPENDHRRNTEDLLVQLAGLMHPDGSLTEELQRTRRRRTAARHAIEVRLRAGRSARRTAA
jgi:hypothetical protein